MMTTPSFFGDAMKTLTEQLSTYAEYHRDTRNIATHCIGIPLIVAAVAILLSRPAFSIGGATLSVATLLTAAALVYYFLLDAGFGVIDPKACLDEAARVGVKEDRTDR